VRSSLASGASPYGVLNMAGNVWEWVADWQSLDYYGTSPYDNPAGPPEVIYRVVRGGTWSKAWEKTRVAFRTSSYPPSAGFVTGIRCAADAPGG